MAYPATGFRNDLIGDLTMDATSNTKTATLTVGNKTYDFPILSGTAGPDVIDIAKLYAQAGMFTYDPGFTSTSRWRGSSRASAATPIRWRSWWQPSARWPRSITTPPTSPIRPSA